MVGTGGRGGKIGWGGCTRPPATLAAANAGKRDMGLGGGMGGGTAGRIGGGTRTELEGGGRRREVLVLLVAVEGETVMGRVMAAGTTPVSKVEELVLGALSVVVVVVASTFTGERC